MTAFAWPEETLPPLAIGAFVDVRTITPGPALDGTELIGATSAGVWRIVLDRVAVNSLARRLIWEAVRARLKGRSGLCQVPLYRGPVAPWPSIAGGRRTEVTFADGARFSDGTAFYQQRIVVTAAAASAGATTVVLTQVSGSRIGEGHVFGVGADRAYEIAAVTSRAGSVVACTISPPLRAALASGTRVDFERPRVRCRLETDDGMAAAFEAGRFAAPSVRFVEVL